MRSTSIAVLISSAALAAGCGGGDDEQAATTPAPTSTPAAASGGGDAKPKGAVEVAMVNFQFEPRDVTVKRGQTITWVNQDSAQHNAVAREDVGPKSELFNGGESYSWTAEAEPGTIEYVCTIHPGMDGSITVR